MRGIVIERVFPVLLVALLAGCDDCRGRPDTAENVLVPVEIVDSGLPEKVHLVESSSVTPYVPTHPELVIGEQAIWLDGEQIVDVVKGAVPISTVRGGKSGYHITPVHDALRRLREQPENEEMVLTIAPSARTRYRLFSQVVYTAGQAAIMAYQFPVRDAEGGKHAIVIALPGHPSAPPRRDPAKQILGHLGSPMPADAGENPLDLMVVVTTEGFRLAALAVVIPGSSEDGSAPNIPLPEGWRETCPADALEERDGLDLAPPACAYDFDALRRQLVTLKSQFPDERDMILSADDSVDWEVIVRTLDATRGSSDAELFPDVVLATGV